MTDYQAKLELAYAPSKYQTAVFEWIERGRGHAVVQAVAGAGKTTFLVSAARLVSGDALFCAFNKEAASQLSAKLTGTRADSRTVHSHGVAAIRRAGVRFQVDGSKYKSMIRQASREYLNNGSVFGLQVSAPERAIIEHDGFPFGQLCKLVDLARLELLDDGSPSFMHELSELVEHHAIELDLQLEGLAAHAIKYCMRVGRTSTKTIDFTDMVWLPTVNGYRPRPYSWVFVDEAQDISKAHLALLRASLRRGGRMLFVGDARQAIYGFAGADSQSLARVIDQLQATELPLSVCYRCPTKVLEAARQYCPQIEAAPGAEEGIVRTASADTLADSVREGDMILCRTNAPLVRACFSLIAVGVAAIVRGRSIGDGLVKTATEALKKRPFEDIGEALEDWLEKQERTALRRFGNDDDKIEKHMDAATDKIDCIRAIVARVECSSLSAFEAEVNALFSDDRGSVVCSSVHRAKGLEADRVFILEPGSLPSGRVRRLWMAQQEKNLAYVAYTRARKELVFLE